MKGIRQQYELSISGTYIRHTSGIIKACCKYESRIKEHTLGIGMGQISENILRTQPPGNKLFSTKSYTKL